MHIPKPIFALLVLVFAIQSSALISSYFSDREVKQAVQAPMKQTKLIQTELNSASQANNIEKSSENENQYTVDSTSESLENDDDEDGTDVSEAQRVAQRYAAENANVLFDNATLNGAWTEQDTFELLPNLVEMTDQDKQTLRERFHTAYNAQELSIENIPPL